MTVPNLLLERGSLGAHPATLMLWRFGPVLRDLFGVLRGFFLICGVVEALRGKFNLFLAVLPVCGAGTAGPWRMRSSAFAHLS